MLYLGGVIPALLLIGFVAGLLPRGWLFIVVAAVAWPLLLLATGTDSGMGFAAGAALLGAANAAAGVALGWSARVLVTRAAQLL